MYLTSLFEVLPKQVTMEDIREVETLPRRFKQECEDGEFNLKQACLLSKPGWVLSCNFSWSSGLSVPWNVLSILFNIIEKIWKIITSFWLPSLIYLPFSFLIHVHVSFHWSRKLHLLYACFVCLVYFPYLSCEVGESSLKSATELAAALLVVVGFGGYLFLWQVHCPVK